MIPNPRVKMQHSILPLLLNKDLIVLLAVHSLLVGLHNPVA